MVSRVYWICEALFSFALMRALVFSRQERKID